LILIYRGVMAGLLQIRDVPESARRVLKARAAARGQSLNTYMLDLIRREVARPTVGEVLARAARRSERAEVSALDGVLADRAERDQRDGLQSDLLRAQDDPQAT
jgi:plasmid stability protein